MPRTFSIKPWNDKVKKLKKPENTEIVLYQQNFDIGAFRADLYFSFKDY